MNRLAFFLLLWLAPATLVFGQIGGVSIELQTDQDQYVPGEDIRLGVRIINQSGETLQLGQDDNWLQFALENNERKPLRQKAGVPVAGVFSLPSSQRGTKWVRISPYFDFRTTGRFYVSASVRIPSWPRPIKSASLAFDIMPGGLLKDVQFGVAVPGLGTNAQPEVRHYLLLDSDRRGRRTLYFSVTDASRAVVYRAIPLSELLAFGGPELQLDASSNAHIINQTGAKTFVYHEINSEGVILGRQTYQFTKTRPQLGLNKAGEIVVVGGERVYAKTDLPSPEMFEPAISDVPSAKP